jgi:hypothetical protein
MTSTRLLFSSVLLLSLVACGPAIRSMTFLSPPPAPKPRTHPIAFYQEARPECPYEEVGTVSARKRSGLVSMEAVAEGLRQRAREIGGDAIIGVGERVETRGGSVVGRTVVANNDPVISGTVIRFRDPGCTR